MSTMCPYRLEVENAKLSLSLQENLHLIGQEKVRNPFS